MTAKVAFKEKRNKGKAAVLRWYEETNKGKAAAIAVIDELCASNCSARYKWRKVQ